MTARRSTTGRQAGTGRSLADAPEGARSSARTPAYQQDTARPSRNATHDSYWFGRCGEVRKSDGEKCKNRLKSKADRKRGMCVGHWNGRGGRDGT